MNYNQNTYIFNNKDTFNNKVLERNLDTYQIQKNVVIPVNFSENYVSNRIDSQTSSQKPMDIYNHGTGNRRAGFVNFSITTPQTKKNTNSNIMNSFNQ